MSFTHRPLEGPLGELRLSEKKESDAGATPASEAKGKKSKAKPRKAKLVRKGQLKPTTPSSTPPATRAGKREYDEYFSLYAQAVQERRFKGFRPLGFVPGPAVVIDQKKVGDEWLVRILDATDDVADGIGREFGQLPTSWLQPEELPAEVREGLSAYKTLCDGLGTTPSPYNRPFAGKVLRGQMPPEYLAAGFLRFRYRSGDPEVPVGVILTPTENGLRVERVYNPDSIPDVPAEGTVLKLEELRDGQGPVQKLLRAHALMERNYYSRFDRDGNPRPESERPRTPRRDDRPY